MLSVGEAGSGMEGTCCIFSHFPRIWYAVALYGIQRNFPHLFIYSLFIEDVRHAALLLIKDKMISDLAKTSSIQQIQQNTIPLTQ